MSKQIIEKKVSKWQIIRHGFLLFERVDGLIIAAALAHFAVLSIIPFLLVGMSLLDWLNMNLFVDSKNH